MILKKYITVLFLIFALNIKAQTNLVPNPSFEVADTCPNTLNQMSRCQSWSSYRESPDYYNTCSTVNGMAPPNVGFGYQYPHSGNAYAGIVTYDNTGLSPNYKEILGTQLTSTLSIGIKYYFSFFVSFGGAQAFTLATDKLGISFSTVPYSYSNPAPINNFADYYENTIITDTINWVQIKGSYIADSIYKYIAIGNFFDDAHTDTSSIGMYNDEAYYFIDDVCLSTDSIYAYTNSIQQINYNKQVSIYPNPAKDRINITSNYLTSYKLISILGDIKKQGKFTFNSTIEVDDLEGGVYILRLNDKDFYKILISR